MSVRRLHRKFFYNLALEKVGYYAILTLNYKHRITSGSTADVITDVGACFFVVSEEVEG